MRYVMKEKLISFGDDFYIKDANGADVYYVDGKVFTLTDQLSFQDLQNRELAYIRKKLISLVPAYEIYRDGKVAAVVKRSLFNILRCTFTVDVPGPDDLVARGDLLDHEYTFRRGDRIVAEVSKKWIALSHTYAVDVGDGEDPVMILASAVVIDQVCHEDHEES